MTLYYKLIKRVVSNETLRTDAMRIKKSELMRRVSLSTPTENEEGSKLYDKNGLYAKGWHSNRYYWIKFQNKITWYFKLELSGMWLTEIVVVSRYTAYLCGFNACCVAQFIHHILSRDRVIFIEV